MAHLARHQLPLQNYHTTPQGIHNPACACCAL
jgi:hypothetical protein